MMNSKRKNISAISAIMIVMIILFSLFYMTGCGGAKTENTDLWKNATYTQDTELGQGKNTVKFEVTAKEKTVTFTIHTNKDNLCEALLENDLISGEDNKQGLYVKVVNGMKADYDTDQSYWAFYINDKMADTGVENIEINENKTYRFEYTK